MLGNSALGQFALAEFPPSFVPLHPTRDTHDYIPKYRHPPVYTDEYYESLRFKAPKEFYENPVETPRAPVPNLRIPLSRLVQAQSVPTLQRSPPYRPVPTLTRNPPAFRMATPDEMASDDEMIIRMILED